MGAWPSECNGWPLAGQWGTVLCLDASEGVLTDMFATPHFLLFFCLM